MSKRTTLIVGTIYTLVLGILVGADVAFTSSLTVLPEYAKAQQSSSSATGIKIQRSPDLPQLLKDLKLSTEPTTEVSLLSRIVPDTIPIKTQVILQSDDRLALFSAVESPDVRAYFFGLKDALQASFSSQVKDLVDSTETPANGPTRNILSFTDPALSEEKLIFIRVRERLYELHVANGKDDAVQALVKKLTE